MSFISGLITGKNAIRAQQLGAQVAGNNISNAAVEGYVRQRVSFTTTPPYELSEGLLVGAGVQVDQLDRIVNKFLEERIQGAISDTEMNRTLEETFARLEQVFNELSENDLSTALNNFFNDLENIQNNPESSSVRTAAITSAQSLADIITNLRTKVDELRALSDSEIATGVGTVNEALEEIAALNSEIVALENGGLNADSASQLRDRRDLLLREVSEFMDIRVDEYDSGAINVTSQGSPLVLGTQVFELSVTEDAVDRGSRVSEVHFSDGRTFVPTTGRLRGILDARDTVLGGTVDELDQLAGAFIFEFNKVYSQGVGIERPTSVESFESVSDPLAALNSAGLAFAPDNGFFDLRITEEASGTVSTFSIDVDLDSFGTESTLTSVAGDINAQLTAAGFTNVSATISADNRLSIQSGNDSVTVSFGQDTSGFLAAMGMNTFFTGSDSATIDVSELVVENPDLFAAARSNQPGDSSNAAALTDLGNLSVDSLEDVGFDDFFESLVARVAVQASKSTDDLEGSDLFLSSLQAERETISGVSIDEEVLDLMAFQRAFEGAARFISTIDEMIQVLLAM